MEDKLDPSKYLFEQASKKPGSVRGKSEADRDATLLIRRLQGPEVVQPETRALLVTYCTEVTLNIRWYEVNRCDKDKSATAQRWFAIALGLAGIVAAALLALITTTQTAQVATATATVSAQLGTLLFGSIAILQILTGATDLKAQVGSFWQAAAELKTALYTLEQTWTGRAFTTGGAGAPEFLDAVKTQILGARKTAGDERKRYFDTFRSPTEVLTLVASALTGFRAKVQQEATPQASTPAEIDNLARSKQVAETRLRLASLESHVIGIKALIKRSEEAKAPQNEVDAAKKSLREAEASVVELKSLISILTTP